MTGSKGVALVTGANRGIGAELCCELSTAGYEVLGTVRNPSLSEADNHVVSVATWIALDLSDWDSIRSASAEITRYASSLDVLVNNAGTNVPPASVGDKQTAAVLGSLEGASLEAMFRINAIGPLLLTQALIPLLNRGRKPRVAMLTTERASLSGSEHAGKYGYRASKVALNMFTRVLAADVHDENVIVLGMDPGWVKTSMGGLDAPVTAREAVPDLVSFLLRATMRHSGRIYDRHGVAQSW